MPKPVGVLQLTRETRLAAMMTMAVTRVGMRRSGMLERPVLNA
jgi:hypothetical protein